MVASRLCKDFCDFGWYSCYDTNCGVNYGIGTCKNCFVAAVFANADFYSKPYI
jgi:hypothetical protein